MPQLGQADVLVVVSDVAVLALAAVVTEYLLTPAKIKKHSLLDM